MADHPLRVLVVDDEKLIADSLAQIFRTRGFDSRAAYNGRSAVEAACTFVPDVLITDVVMPGMSGWDVALEYSHVLPACRVILFSGQADTADLRDQAGALAFEYEVYTKPVPPQIFINRLQIEAELLH